MNGQQALAKKRETVRNGAGKSGGEEKKTEKEREERKNRGRGEKRKGA